MADPQDASLIRSISDEVAVLAKSYGGLLWGEHGRGFRGEYSPLFFGPKLFEALCGIKAAFDPENVFNPGKLAVPPGQGALLRIDDVPLRGESDRHVDAARAAGYGGALACNGNAACHALDTAGPMCPSYKATRDKVQSPKGRAVVLREWARLVSERDRGKPVEPGLAQLERGVKAALDTCLACQACSNQCPVRVDIPTMRSRFFADYHRTRPRCFRDRVMAHMESGFPLGRRFPVAVNGLLSTAWVRKQLERRLGLVDLPRFSPQRRSARRIEQPGTRAGPTVVLLRDSFLSTFDGRVLEATIDVLSRLGFEVVTSPVWANGKAEHVLGMHDRFKRKASNAQDLRMRLAAPGTPLLSVDAATGLMFKQEYEEFAPRTDAPAVLPLERFLFDVAPHAQPHAACDRGRAYRLLLHCTERTARPETAQLWQDVLARFGISALVPPLGCCGMSGMFGHQAEHAELSARIFEQSWGQSLSGVDPQTVLATGFSCRCQAKRFNGHRPRHPIELIADVLTGARARSS